jgi:protein-S-isoprenylcysteine O-methyltransferase Ste14
MVIAALGAALARKRVPSATIGTESLVASIGLVLLWCGLGLRLWSFQTLGRYFTFTVQTSPDQPVISAGPYRVIRHPGYAGMLLAVIGLGFTIDNWVSLVVLTGAVASGLIYRIVVEERALSRDLGGRYQAYARSRRRLIPFVW